MWACLEWKWNVLKWIRAELNGSIWIQDEVLMCIKMRSSCHIGLFYASVKAMCNTIHLACFQKSRNAIKKTTKNMFVQQIRRRSNFSCLCFGLTVYIKSDNIFALCHEMLIGIACLFFLLTSIKKRWECGSDAATIRFICLDEKETVFVCNIRIRPHQSSIFLAARMQGSKRCTLMQKLRLIGSHSNGSFQTDNIAFFESK